MKLKNIDTTIGLFVRLFSLNLLENKIDDLNHIWQYNFGSTLHHLIYNFIYLSLIHNKIKTIELVGIKTDKKKNSKNRAISIWKSLVNWNHLIRLFLV